jgi:hypothetical protein
MTDKRNETDIDENAAPRKFDDLPSAPSRKRKNAALPKRMPKPRVKSAGAAVRTRRVSAIGRSKVEPSTSRLGIFLLLRLVCPHPEPVLSTVSKGEGVLPS